MTSTLSRTFAERSNVVSCGAGPRTLLCAHGFCSDASVFRHQVAAFRETHRVVTYDLAGFGRSASDVWDPQRHSRLEGYAEDLVILLDELDLRHVTLIGASMSAMVGLMASLARPDRFDALVFVGASPRYLNDAEYFGGFERDGLSGFYQLVDHGSGWEDAVTKLMLNEPVSLALQEIADRVRSVTPGVAGVAARAIFESDYRALLGRARHPVLVTQTRFDQAVPESVGRYLSQRVPNALLRWMPGVGHIPHFTQPEVFNEAIRDFLEVQGLLA